MAQRKIKYYGILLAWYPIDCFVNHKPISAHFVSTEVADLIYWKEGITISKQPNKIIHSSYIFILLLIQCESEILLNEECLIYQIY